MANSSFDENGLPKRIQVPKTAELIAQQLRGQIVRGVLKPGDMLPPETVLGQRFDVSRPTLREAFRILENESLIVVRRGSRGGVQVVSPDVSVAARYIGLLLQIQNTTLSDLYEARMVLEPAAVRMLAARRTDDDLKALVVVIDELADLVDAGADAADLDQWSRTAFRFHDLILERAGNQAIGLIGQVLADVVATHMSRVVSRSTDTGEVAAQFKKTIRAFRKLITLVEARDAEAAEAHWRRHMKTAAKKMLWGRFATESVVDLFN
ncbi:FCD domain-containing protein [Gordonia amicalis]|nr:MULTISPECIES: FCD domain-containing protein [Gordonia]MBA5845727.1 FadR family transcriptional regulator [Gordonia amicalis]MCZ0914834.1 FCD domain-containing protein [Gordonia amicalis]MDV7099329.1 FCD domain-containing protein [Gordonia amicalis]MDV7174821.1 FCD domain-containing protein [Gordonia amicalis]NKX78389.1 FadR family transcriptional regulator [Gordonia amicalis]